MLKPSHKAIRDYHDSLADLVRHGIVNEMGLRSAFQALLDGTARARKFRFVPEQRSGSGLVRPDGVVYDENHLPRGWWEAKDSKDDLAKEIDRKIAKGYPTTNIIFEDGRRAVLMQNARESLTADLGEAVDVAKLLNAFYDFTPPAYKDFEQAKERFKLEIPDLAKGLLAKIEEGHKKNKEFRAAFEAFFELCKTSLNPNIRKEAVEEMLVQHLLTERLIRTVFDNPDFVRRNVIASEVEKVLDALFAGSESRQAYLRNLDRFYVAIEEAARSIPEFHDKQHFLNTVYERFFQGYSVKLADTHGIVYTPQPIVDFMCASVEEVLKTEFKKTLGSEDVYIIDPCTGTGNFIVNLLHRMDGKDIERVYRHQLFANEVMLLPYYIAALNIEHAYFERTGRYEPFEGMCFVDTLDLAEGTKGHHYDMGLFSQENTARVERQRKSPITVVIGNPPYNTNQLDENDNNKNRGYDVIDRRIQETYTRDSEATNRNKLGDAYVRFYRWSTDRLEDRPGIVCFVSNNGFLRGIAFDGFRKHLAQDFDTIYHFDFKGNARTSGERRRQEGGNIFADLIRVGIGITVLVRTGKKKPLRLGYHTVGDYWPYEKKSEYLNSFASVADVPWQPLAPDSKNNWLVAEHADEYDSMIPLGTKEAKSSKRADSEVVFGIYSLGVNTNRDDWVYGCTRDIVTRNVKSLIELYNSEIDRWQRAGRPKEVDSFVIDDPQRIKWSSRLKELFIRGVYAEYNEAAIRNSIFRPFDRRILYFDPVLNQRQFVFRSILPTPATESENRVICVSTISTTLPFHCLVTNVIPDLHLTGDTQCFPFYVHNEDGTGRRENITDWALAEFRQRYSDTPVGAALRGRPLRKKAPNTGAHTGAPLRSTERAITKWDIFYYVYGLLHHPGYRERFADNLKRELPRLPFAPDFWAFSDAGKKLAELHLKYEELKPIWEDRGSAIKLVRDPKAKPREVWHVEKMKLSKPSSPQISDLGGTKGGLRELTVNKYVTVTNIPPEVFAYRLGNRSALEWVVDQYRIKSDKRSGITSDPNREDDPEYIVRLVGQVIRVSLETVKIVNALPDKFS